MDIDLFDLPQYWREIMAGAGLLWSEGAARAKVWHIRLPFALGRIRAITLFPFVFYAKGHYTPCIIAHEKVHVAQVRKLGFLVFLLRYLWLKRKYGGGPAHPMESAAYYVQANCEEAREALEGLGRELAAEHMGAGV